jgi:hypothetical protein
VKNTFISITIFILVIILCFTSRYLLNFKLNSYIESFGTIKNLVDKNDWTNSTNICETTLIDFEKNSVFISFIVTNELVEKINFSLQNTLFYLKQENKEDALFSCNEANLYFENTIYLQRITIKNIF